MRCVVLEISRGGAEINPPPAGSRLAQTPAGARVNGRAATAHLTIHLNKGITTVFRGRILSAKTTYTKF